MPFCVYHESAPSVLYPYLNIPLKGRSAPPEPKDCFFLL